jgi:hypothetical protein
MSMNLAKECVRAFPYSGPPVRLPSLAEESEFSDRLELGGEAGSSMLSESSWRRVPL